MKDRFEVLDRELAIRESDNMEIALMWVPGTGRPSSNGLVGGDTYVEVADGRLKQLFRIIVPEPSRAMDVFMHPFSYQAEELGIATGEDYGAAS